MASGIPREFSKHVTTLLRIYGAAEYIHANYPGFNPESLSAPQLRNLFAQMVRYDPAARAGMRKTDAAVFDEAMAYSAKELARRSRHLQVTVRRIYEDPDRKTKPTLRDVLKHFLATPAHTPVITGGATKKPKAGGTEAMDRVSHNAALVASIIGDETSFLNRACPKCGAQTVRRFEEQRRSADEAATITEQCMTCQFILRRD